MSADEFTEWTVIRPEFQPLFETLNPESFHCPEHVLKSVSVTDNSEPAEFAYMFDAQITTDNRMLFSGQTLGITTEEPLSDTTLDFQLNYHTRWETFTQRLLVFVTFENQQFTATFEQEPDGSMYISLETEGDPTLYDLGKIIPS